MFGLNPVASGILLGSIGGPAGMLIGGGIGAMQDNAQGQRRDAERAMVKEQGKQVANQNALVTQQYNNKKAARGLADAINNPEAQGMAQSGATLNSMTGNDSLINILG